MKPNSNQYQCLISEFNNICEKNENNEDTTFLFIKKEFYDYFFKQKPIEIKLNNSSQNLKKILDNMGNNSLFSIRKLTDAYNKEFKNKISKTTIHKKLKYDLNYHYLKTAPKNAIASSQESIKRCFFVIKIICRTIVLGGEIIYLDECAFYNYNNNLRAWKLNNEKIFQKLKDNKKFNLLMAVSSKKVYGFVINDDTTNSKTFEKFMEYLLNNMSKIEIKNAVFFMDNLNSHKTCELFSFYKNNNIKVLFNCPYISEFNMIEYCFRYIKNLTYKRLYSSIFELKKDVTEIIKSKNFENTLEKLYKDTLSNYINFIDKNKYQNLNL